MSGNGQATQKNHVCPLDGRKFASKAALEAHRRDSHGVQQNPSTSRAGNAKRGKRKVGGGAGAGLPGVSVAPLRLPANSSSDIVVSGEDRVCARSVSASAVLISGFSVTPSLSDRLQTLSKAYQRISYESLTFYVTPQAPLTTMGGYVAGFVMDADDASVTLNQLSANVGAVTKKWYETAVVPMPRSPGQYYTGLGHEPRLSSPGTFWLMSDGLPNQTVQVVLSVKWKVRLSCATYGESLSFKTRGKIVSNPNNYDLKWQDDTTSLSEDFSSFVPPNLPTTSTGYHYFRVPTFNVEYSEGTGDTGTMQMHFIVYRPSDKRMYYSQSGTAIDTQSWQGSVAVQVLVPCGTLARYAGVGNSRCPQVEDFRSSHLRAPQEFSAELREIMSSLKSLLERSRNIPSLSSHSSLEKLGDLDS